jgi:biofilm PGA synthesis protein PgaA
MTQREPEKAETALRRGEQLDPTDRLLQLELFYALVELERLEEALAIPDTMAARLDAVNQVPGSSVTQPNRVKIQAEIMAGSGRAFAEQLRDAEKRLSELVDAAPNNQEARTALGNVYSWRGWKERAETEYNQVLTINPDQADARTSRSENAMDLQKFRHTEAELQAVRSEYVTVESVWDLNKRWIVHNYSQLWIETRWGESSGQTFGNEQYDIEAWWFTSPLKYNYRLYARTFDSWAEFLAGDHSRRRAAAGTEFRKGPWIVTGELNFDRSGLDDTGFASRMGYRISDTWYVGAELELNSYSTPLLADRADIGSDLLALDTTFRQHESWSLSGGVYYQDFDDGNDVLRLNADTRWRLFERIRYMLDGYADVSASKSSKDDAVYFNPERDFQLLVGVDNFWRQFRSYDKVLSHRFGANIGLYDQQRFGSDSIWTLDYDLNWDINQQFALRIGWERSRRVYDGGREYATFWLFGFNGWF